jgi:hypothetical protein
MVPPKKSASALPTADKHKTSLTERRFLPFGRLA